MPLFLSHIPIFGVIAGFHAVIFCSYVELVSFTQNELYDFQLAAHFRAERQKLAGGNPVSSLFHMLCIGKCNKDCSYSQYLTKKKIAFPSRLDCMVGDLYTSA